MIFNYIMVTTYDYDISPWNSAKLYTSQTIVNILKQSRFKLHGLCKIIVF